MVEYPKLVQKRVRWLLGSGPRTLMQLEHLCYRGWDSFLDSDVSADGDYAVLHVAAQFLDATAAFRVLITKGHIRASMSQLRAMIEARAVIEYLHGDDVKAARWFKAETRHTRAEFSFNKVYRSAENASFWKEMWDLCCEKVHTNANAFPVQSRSRPVMGGDTWIGPFYDPSSIARLFLMALAFTIWFGRLTADWHSGQPTFPESFETDLERLAHKWTRYESWLQPRADAETAALQELSGTIPLEEQRRALDILLKGAPPEFAAEFRMKLK